MKPQMNADGREQYAVITETPEYRRIFTRKNMLHVQPHMETRSVIREGAPATAAIPCLVRRPTFDEIAALRS